MTPFMYGRKCEQYSQLHVGKSEGTLIKRAQEHDKSLKEGDLKISPQLTSGKDGTHGHSRGNKNK